MDGSWVVEDEHGEGSSSWDEGPDASEQHEEHPTFKPESKMTRVVRERRKSPRREAPPPPAEPQFIMPTISTDLPQNSRHRIRKPQMQTRIPPSRFQSSESMRANQPGTLKFREAATSPVTDRVFHILVSTAEWLLDILGHTLNALKRPISWLVAIYVFVGIVMMGQNLLTSSIYTALSPICRIPGASLLGLPMCRYSSPNTDHPTISAGTSAPVEFDALMKSQSQFEDILSESAAGISLPLDMKRSETSIRDLRHVVRYSQLASRNEMVLEFDGFVETARMASYDLQKFNSHVGRGVDIVLSTAHWTQRVLDDMSYKQASRGLLPRMIQDNIFAPFQPIQFTEAMLLDQYIAHTQIVSGEIERLIGEAQALLLVLQNLEDRLDVIHSIATHDNVAAQAGKDEILTHLWTTLGGNRAQLGKLDKQLNLLSQVGQYRKVAWAHVSGTILRLQAMGAELEELRTRVSSAEVLRDHKEIPLAVHIENIRLGVERLEEGRDKARKLERDHTRRVLDGGQQGNLMVGDK